MRTELFLESSRRTQSRWEEQFDSEQPYLTQTLSWKEGMKYRYSPESFPLDKRQLQRMQQSGNLIGKLLNQTCKSSVLEFRIDFVLDGKNQPWIAEVQTDDRGIPAMAITRNYRGSKQPDIFSELPLSFINSLKIVSGKSDPTLLITYPDDEYFYYAGFYDFARLCWAVDENVEIIICPRKTLNPQGQSISFHPPDEGAEVVLEPDLIWDFSGSLPASSRQIQPLVNKQLLLDVWGASDESLLFDLRKFVPRATKPLSPEVIKNKNDWLLKPISGKWSQSVVIGESINQAQWEEFIKNNSDNSVAQKFVPPRQESFYVRKNNGGYDLEMMFARLEGYYCLAPQGWILADVLVTCIPGYPVHGRRDCIMIPGELKFEREK